MKEIALKIHCKKAQFQKDLKNFMGDTLNEDQLARNCSMEERKGLTEIKHISVEKKDKLMKDGLQRRISYIKIQKVRNCNKQKRLKSSENLEWVNDLLVHELEKIDQRKRHLMMKGNEISKHDIEEIKMEVKACKKDKQELIEKFSSALELGNVFHRKPSCSYQEQIIQHPDHAVRVESNAEPKLFVSDFAVLIRQSSQSNEKH